MVIFCLFAAAGIPLYWMMRPGKPPKSSETVLAHETDLVPFASKVNSNA
jgi:hypothetical protein